MYKNMAALLPDEVVEGFFAMETNINTMSFFN
jgi:hypothetical protein